LERRTKEELLLVTIVLLIPIWIGYLYLYDELITTKNELLPKIYESPSKFPPTSKSKIYESPSELSLPPKFSNHEVERLKRLERLERLKRREKTMLWIGFFLALATIAAITKYVEYKRTATDDDLDTIIKKYSLRNRSEKEIDKLIFYIEHKFRLTPQESLRFPAWMKLAANDYQKLITDPIWEEVVKGDIWVKTKPFPSLSQIIILLVGGVLIALRLFFPPTKYDYSYDYSLALLHALGIAAITGVILYSLHYFLHIRRDERLSKLRLKLVGLSKRLNKRGGDS